LIGHILEPYLLVWLGLLLFVNLIRLNPKELLANYTRPTIIIILSVLKLLILPIGIFAITYLIYPKLTLSATLLSGISTALGAPFAVNFIGRGSLSTMVDIIVVTSIAVPFTLPAIVYILFGQQISVPIFDMMFLLVAGLLVPLFAGWIITRNAQRLATTIDKKSLPLSLILIVLINLSVFARFSSYFFIDPAFIFELLIAVFILFCLYCIAGYYYYHFYYKILLTIGRIIRTRIKKTSEKKDDNKSVTKVDRITGLLAMTYISNVLVVVIAQQFFDIQTEALAAFYQIPYYGGLLFLKKWLS
jgi:bile acid:Na+ symporter, BASS family